MGLWLVIVAFVLSPIFATILLRTLGKARYELFSTMPQCAWCGHDAGSITADRLCTECGLTKEKALQRRFARRPRLQLLLTSPIVILLLPIVVFGKDWSGADVTIMVLSLGILFGGLFLQSRIVQARWHTPCLIWLLLFPCAVITLGFGIAIADMLMHPASSQPYPASMGPHFQRQLGAVVVGVMCATGACIYQLIAGEIWFLVIKRRLRSVSSSHLQTPSA